MGDQRCCKCGAGQAGLLFLTGDAENKAVYTFCKGHLDDAAAFLEAYADEKTEPPYPICAYSNAGYTCGDRAEWVFWIEETLVPACSYHLAAMLPSAAICSIVRLQGTHQ